MCICYIFALIMRKYKSYIRYICHIWVLLLWLTIAPTETAKGNPAVILFKPYITDSILDNIFKQAEIYATKVQGFNADLYLKGNMHIHKRNRIIKYLPSMFRLEKGVNEYVYESLSELQFTYPRIYDRKIRAIASTFPGGNGRFFDVIDFLKFNIYNPSVMEDKVLSPLNKSNRIHYTYLLDSIAYRQNGQIFKIRFIPRYHSTQLLDGSFWIAEKDWSLRYIEFEGKYDLIKFKVDMKMGTADKEKLLPQFFNLNLNFSFLKNHLEMNYTGWMKYKDIILLKNDESLLEKEKAEKKRLNLSNSYVLTCDTSRMVQHRDSFNRIRPLPLTDYEEKLYTDFYNRKQNNLLDSIPFTETKRKKSWTYIGQVGDALISSYDIDMSKIGSVTCSPIINPLLISYSHRKGFSYRQEFKYNKLFHDGKLLHIVPKIGYNFTKKELYASLDGEFVYQPIKNGKFSINVGNGNRIYSSVVLDQLKEKQDSVIDFEKMQLDYFKDTYLNLSHNIEITNGLNLWTGISMHWRRMARPSKEVAERVRLRYNSFAPRIRLEWTPYMHYYINGNRKINVGSYFPTFTLDYEHGIKWIKDSGEYGRMELSAEQRIRLRHLHTIAYHIGGGFFTHKEDMYFVDYVDFANRNLPQGWNDDIGGTFQMLDGRWYNASKNYFRGNITYETPFLLLYPVSKMLSWIQKERIYAGLLFMPHLNPYFELGYGIGTHIFDFGVFIGNENGKFTSAGCKFTFELFNK